MQTYTPPGYQPGTGSSKYVPDNYNAPNSLPHVDGDRQAPPSRHVASQGSRPYTPPDPEQYDASPDYRAPLDNRPANPDVQAVQAAAGYGGRPRSRSRATSHLSARSRPSPDGRRASHGSHRSRHSTSARSHHSSAPSRSGEVPYRTESERDEYIKDLKRVNSKRPTLSGTLFSMWDSMKKSVAK